MRKMEDILRKNRRNFDNIVMLLPLIDGIESQYVAIVERMLDDSVACISHILGLVICAFVTYL